MFTLPEIKYASQSSFYKSGNRSSGKLIQEMFLTPKRSKKIRKAYADSLKNIKSIPYNPEEALAFIIENNLTKT